MVNTRSSSSTASRRRPCRSANAAIVSFMPPSSCDHVPSNAATSARWSSRLRVIASFIARISAASRST